MVPDLQMKNFIPTMSLTWGGLIIFILLTYKTSQSRVICLESKSPILCKQKSYETLSKFCEIPVSILLITKLISLVWKPLKVTVVWINVSQRHVLEGDCGTLVSF
jgi:hypothetical protein